MSLLSPQSATANGKTHTISYVWSLPQVAKKMMFTLTTAYSENVQIQVMASTANISD
ncbi:NMCC_0638 family (lipo)protein [Collimonas humicola]|uniref:NMCC_0638 family (lipo)protein n=1 Tax=Collimonas humicola TaxID=2825886 RepID=UPI0038B3B704